MKPLRTLLFFVVTALPSGCAPVDAAPRPEAFAFRVRVTADDRTPVEGAEVIVEGAPAARTGASGEVELRVASAAEGERRALVVRCPADYQSANRPIDIALHAIGDAARRPRYEVTCDRARRTVVVAVRAQNGPGLPVVYLGREIARTDAAGAAHVALKLAPGDTFRLTLDTSAPESAALRPQSPSAEFAVGESDDLVVFDQKLSRLETKAAPRRRADHRPRPL